MKLSESFFYTLREDVKNEDCVSSNLLVKSGMVKKVSSGIYMYMPLGLKVLNNIEQIIREEMNEAGALELSMPCLIPSEVYEQSGRKENFGNSMFTLKDRNDREYVLGPTHEELFVNAASSMIKSYKDMPFNIYQMANKYRDEARPRYGLIRVREFIMKDAYTFDKDEKGLDNSYRKMYNTYRRIFDRCGVKYKIVEADTGVMGGLLSEEFQAIADIGEDTIVYCNNCGYAANNEIFDVIPVFEKVPVSEKEKKLVYTPNTGSIKALVEFGYDINKLTKTMIYKNEREEFYACVIPATREINDYKLRRTTNSLDINLASPEEVKEITGADIGFVGPYNLNIPIIVDKEVVLMKDFLVGANKNDYHYENFNVGDIWPGYKVADIKFAVEKDHCPECQHEIEIAKSIEIGNIFKLGSKYCEALGLKYLDQNNQEQYPLMGCYGIGVERVLASLVEQNNDEKGIIFPLSVAPYKVAIVLIDKNDRLQNEVAQDLYNELMKKGIDTLLDDRDERPGVKFNDMDLIGIPIRVTVGKKVYDDLVELKRREKHTSEDIDVNNIYKEIKAIMDL